MTADSDRASNSALGYTRTAVSLHWSIGALLVCGFALGWIMTDLPISPLRLRMYNWHKWVGVTILALVMVRIAWRLGHRAPPLLPMPRWQASAAHALHGILYLLMLALPLSGWVYSNASGYPIVYLGKVPLPNLVSRDKALAQQWLEIHELLGWLLAAAIVLHVLAALKHHLIDRDATLSRMLRWQRN